MIDLSSAVTDPRFAQTFPVYRKTGKWNADGDFEQIETEIPMIGTISIASAKQIEFIPEGDRVGGEIAIHCVKELFTSRNAPNESGTADELLWHEERYKIYSVNPYSDYGYFSAIGQRLASD
ncbi:hypothetical protein CLPUN_42340 [Clostridium puniceum]|uniref:Uncharacterized protein n=1 Tax=Clostridium puniceum TaxID=29367 RepID=A0A1S8T8B9_9CLOT|nr:hypothetical protein [Clostridium puniceum]OOM73996.1 hypothetical protein CLPUN_42340 [Clostridium puniceum]